MKPSSLPLIVTTVALAFLASCNRDVIYSHYEHTDPIDWRQGDTIKFLVTDIPSADSYSAILGLRATSAYPYTDFSVSVAMQTAEWQLTDTVLIAIASEEGHSLGSGIMYRQYIVPLRQVALNEGDTLHIAIAHNMRCKMLEGISDVGITIKRDAPDLTSDASPKNTKSKQ